MPSRDIAVILENIVFLLFRKYGYDICIGRIDDMEVDFIVSRGLYRYYLQVATSLSDEATRRREYKSLDGIDDSFPKYVVHLDEIDW
jgi:predicted AAA+ superfamily ATPase